MLKPRHLLLALVIAFLPAALTHAQHHKTQHGAVAFETSCSTEAAQEFTSGLALLHSMMYEQAEEYFVRSKVADPECAIAYWGIAMSVIHPLWGERPSDAALERGSAAIARAAEITKASERERDFVDAVSKFFDAYESTSYPDQLKAFEAGYRALHEKYPEDVEAAAFYALSHIATAPKGDATLSHQIAAGELLERMYRRAPEHPGLFHYTIHAYDHPRLAERAIDVARAYDSIAPDVPHALHMPSHIFVRLGYWDDVISWNERSAAAALRQPVGNETSTHYPHALDYLAYAHLQKGEDDEAGRVVEKINEVSNFQPGLATAYAVAAVNARYPLERGVWQDAAKLEARPNAGFAWEPYPGAEAITVFARGIGAARSGDVEAARTEGANLDRLHDRMMEMGETYWATLADAQRKAIRAWIMLVEGDEDEAIALMTEAAEVEDSVDKHPVTPGAVLPARELLGDMLMETGRPDAALAAYQACLSLSANRLNSLGGAARAAQLTGDDALARSFHARIADLTTKEASRDVIKQTRLYLSEH